MELVEKYRPEVWTDFIGNEDAVALARGLCQKADRFKVWLSGESSTGKTSLAYLIARELGAEMIEVDGQDCNIAWVRDWARCLRQSSLFSKTGWRVWIVNESHTLTRDAVSALLTILEKLPPKRGLICTSTAEIDSRLGQIELFEHEGKAFFSRFKRIKLSSRGLCEGFAVRLRQIAAAEGVDGKDIKYYQSLLKESANNMRDAIETVEKQLLMKGA